MSTLYRSALFATALLCCAASGCAALPSLKPQVSATVTLDTGKAIALLWTSLDGAALAVEQAQKAGALSAAQAQTAAHDLAKAQTALQALTDAYHAGAAANAQAQITAITSAIADVNALAKGV